MASNVPVIKQIAWISLVPQLLVAGLFIYLFYLLNFPEYLLAGMLAYYLLSTILRNVVGKWHRIAMKLVKQQMFLEAVPCFEKSVAFFTKNPWVDKYRFVTLLSSSRMTYREMGLCNIAFCYSQIGEGLKSKTYYQQVLAEYPNNGLAIAGLNALEAGKGDSSGK